MVARGTPVVCWLQVGRRLADLCRLAEARPCTPDLSGPGCNVLPRGARYVAVVIPAAVRVTEAAAFSRRGELSRAIPFYDRSFPLFAAWLRPGEPLQPRATYRIGSGVTDGKPWSERRYLGPWGQCIAGAGAGADCIAQTGSLLKRGEVNELFVSAGSGSGQAPYWYVGEVARTVGYLRFTLSDGTRIRVAAVDAGGQKFYVFAVASGARVKPLRWTAFTAGGTEVGSGTGG